MIIHILGGGPGQLSAIRRCRELGLRVLVTDMNELAPGCLEADWFRKASTFSSAETADAALRFEAEEGGRIGALLVTGTDQPVLTAAETAERLGIRYFLGVPEALLLTNKRVMKERLSSCGIPVAPFKFVSRGFDKKELSDLNFPVVVKPLDSQGQRGVYRLESAEQVAEVYDEVEGFSRLSEILVEEYYPSDEITVSGWVEDGRYYRLSVTDRRTVDNGPSIGVCLSHQYPSRFSDRLDEIDSLTRKIIASFGMKRGPVYFQYLVGEKGIIVNETAARLGGAYEDEFIPYITGVDILDLMIRMSCGMEYDRRILGGTLRHAEGRVVSLQMFFCREGMIEGLSGMDEVLALPGVASGKFLLPVGTPIRCRRNSTQRAGYFIVFAESRREADETVRRAYDLLRINDKNGENMIGVYDKMFFGG